MNWEECQRACIILCDNGAEQVIDSVPWLEILTTFVLSEVLFLGTYLIIELNK
jgi:hypothetical protein